MTDKIIGETRKFYWFWIYRVSSNFIDNEKKVTNDFEDDLEGKQSAEKITKKWQSATNVLLQLEDVFILKWKHITITIAMALGVAENQSNWRSETRVTQSRRHFVCATERNRARISRTWSQCVKTRKISASTQAFHRIFLNLGLAVCGHPRHISITIFFDVRTFFLSFKYYNLSWMTIPRINIIFIQNSPLMQISFLGWCTVCIK